MNVTGKATSLSKIGCGCGSFGLLDPANALNASIWTLAPEEVDTGRNRFSFRLETQLPFYFRVVNLAVAFQLSDAAPRKTGLTEMVWQTVHKKLNST